MKKKEFNIINKTMTIHINDPTATRVSEKNYKCRIIIFLILDPFSGLPKNPVFLEEKVHKKKTQFEIVYFQPKFSIFHSQILKKKLVYF